MEFVWLEFMHCGDINVQYLCLLNYICFFSMSFL